MTGIRGWCALWLLPLGAAAQVGVTDLPLHDAARDRPVELTIWYPATGPGAAPKINYDLAFAGQAWRNGRYLASAGRRPLLMLSHGDRGSPVDQSWLAEALAAEGYIVAAAAHWLNTWKKNTPEATLKVWERPRDIRFAIDALLADADWGPRIDAQRIAAAGHSAGGYTALALAGAIYKPGQMALYCQAGSEGRECNLGDGADIESIDFSPALASYRDARIRAIIAMAPALGPGIQPESLAGITVPVLIMADRKDELLDFERHAAAYAAGIPTARLVPLSQGGHFAFMPECTFMGKVFTWFHRFDICGRRAGLEGVRPDLHATITREVIAFLSTHLEHSPLTATREITP